MSLETILQQRWPLPTSVPRIDEDIDDLANKLEARKLFTEGYNAALKEVKERVENSISNAYLGLAGCKSGDTDFDSLSVAYGYKSALEDVQSNLTTL